MHRDAQIERVFDARVHVLNVRVEFLLTRTVHGRARLRRTRLRARARPRASRSTDAGDPFATRRPAGGA